MTDSQKIIKNLALAFAIFLIIAIFSLIISGINGVLEIFKPYAVYEEIIENNISNLEIDITSSNLIIQKNDEFKVETNNDEITYEQNNNKLIIKEKKHNWIKRRNETDLIIYIPNKSFLDVKIKTGAGKVTIDSLETDNLDLNLGAGKIEIDYLESKKSSKIETGAGEVIIKNSKLNNLDFDMGVGKVTLTSLITGNNYINTGIGSLTLDILNYVDNYEIQVNKGLGKVLINNEEVSNKEVIGTGNNKIKLECGIGEVKVNFLAN